MFFKWAFRGNWSMCICILCILCFQLRKRLDNMSFIFLKCVLKTCLRINLLLHRSSKTLSSTIPSLSRHSTFVWSVTFDLSHCWEWILRKISNHKMNLLRWIDVDLKTWTTMNLYRRFNLIFHSFWLEPFEYFITNLRTSESGCSSAGQQGHSAP